MMKPHKEVLDVFKSGIQEFIEIAVKQQHDHLLARLPDIVDSGFTRLESCFECNRNNLKPRHSESECPSLNYCFCKNRRRAKRPCPNRICDFIHEGIIEDHIKYSPNLKNTDISQWTQNYWDIAKCYMKHSSQSAGSTDLLDLLHLIANNRYVQQKLVFKETEMPEQHKEPELSEFRNVLHKVIKICRRTGRSAGMCSSDDLTQLRKFLSKVDDQNSTKAVAHFDKLLTDMDCAGNNKKCSSQVLLHSVREAVYEHFKSAENALHCRQTEDDQEFTSLQLDFEQELLVAETVKSFEDGKYIDSSIVKEIFDCRKHKTICVASSTEDEDQGSTQWSEKEWFIYNVLNIHFNTKSKQTKKNDFSALLNKDCQYSDIIVVSKSVSNRTNMPLKLFCEGILNDVLPTLQNCLVVLDFSDAVVEGVFKQKNHVLKGHTTVKLHKSKDFHNMKNNRKLITTYVKTKPVNGLTIRNVGEDLKLKKEATDIIHQILYKSMKKIGDKDISSLTFERVCFGDISTKVKLSCISQLTTLRLRECAFTPVNFKCVLFIEILSEDKKLSHYLEQAKVILYPAIQTCHGLQQVSTSEIKIGNKSFYMKLNSKEMDNSANVYFGTALRSCSKEHVYDLLCIEIAKTLMAAGADIDDFQLAREEEEKAMVLNSIQFGLLKENQNFVTVYPAECYLTSRKSKDVVFVCYMKENADIDKEYAWGKYRGFETFQRSYNEVSSESFLAESSVVELKDTYRTITDEQVKKDIEETVAFRSRELMKEHSNLEVIGVSMGKARIDSLDLREGPYIVLYVRLKSFIPSGERRFPTKLSHPSKQSIEFKTDVREGYYIPLADCAQFYPEMKVPNLVMGCSIGFPGNDFAATVGPFVEFESGSKETKTTELGFITVCHLFGLPGDAQTIVGKLVVQPSDGDEPFVNLSSGTRELGLSNDKVCGEVVACSYDEEVDAALVKITRRHPHNGTFITCQRRDLQEAGFHDVPEYKDGSISNLQDAFRQNVVKVGKTTKLSLGLCCFKGVAVKIFEHTLSVKNPLTRENSSVTMNNLFQIGGVGDKFKTFSDSGDSGAGVFIVGSDNKLSCIGMVIGKTSDGYCVATPIHTILEKLSGSRFTRLDNLKVTMKTFDQ